MITIHNLNDRFLFRHVFNVAMIDTCVTWQDREKEGFHLVYLSPNQINSE